jgi:phage minor structural protein
MTVYLFDNNKALIGEVVPLNYTQKSILGGTITASITAIYSPEIEAAHYFGSKDIDDENTFHLYRVTSEKKRNGLLELSGIHILFEELQGHVIRDIRPSSVTPAVALGRILENTGWQVGIQSATGTASSTYYYQSTLSAFWDFIKTWRVEFKPRLTFSNGQITGRYIDIYNNMSDNYGKWYEYGDKLITVEAEQANEGIFTALVGLGKGEETGEGFGRKINFSGVSWSIANGDPVDKPLGQDYVSLPSAVSTYGFREAVIDFPDIEDRAELLQATYLELLNVSRPKVEFSASAIETEQIELGEIVTVIRDDLGIRYQTRVFELTRNFLNKTVKSFRFGDRIITSSAERIKAEREKTDEKIKEQQSLLVAVRREITDAYWGTDGYNYDLRPSNEYGLPAGLYSFDKPIDQDPTEVIYIGAGKALIANSKDPNGEWVWRTALTAEGFAGEEIVANSVTLNKLASDVGQGLDISSNVSITSKVSRDDLLTDPELQQMIISNTEPEEPNERQLWLDTSTHPNIIKRWDGAEWEIVSDIQQIQDALDGKVSHESLSDELQNIMASITASYQSEFEQTATDINFRFTEVIDAINAEGGRITNLSNEIETNIRFTSTGIEMGKTTSPISIQIMHNRIAFVESGREVAYFSNNTLFITDVNITGRFTFHDFGFTRESNGSITWGKVT